VGFVETHGTATPLGDPIEVEALAATIGAPRADGSICYLGSAKANLGHMEAAAGVAGLIKATLVLQHREIPKQVHFRSLNPHLSLGGTCLAVADAHRAWPAGAFPRVAGVSGFGVGGTNAHVLVEEAPPVAADDERVRSVELQLLPLSAQSPAALRAVVEKWIPFLQTDSAALEVICATASERRSHYDHRLAVTGHTSAGMVAQLRAYLAGDASTVAQGSRPQSGAPTLAFVFSGQGPQWAGMGRELAEREPVFRDVLADLDTRFREYTDWSLLAMLAEPQETSRLMETEVAQPAIFAVQVALAALWESWGVIPDAVVGHSIGELAALHVAGVLSVEDAVRVVFHRGRIMQRATGRGRMAAVSLAAEEASRLVAEVGPDLSLAAVNGPRSTVLAGSSEALDRALAILAAREVQSRTLPVSYAFHSTQMAPFEAELVAALGSVTAQPARLAVYSTVTGTRLDPSQVTAAYFGRNVRSAVRFAPAIDAMLDQQVSGFVEVGPHPVLSAALAECIGARGRDLPVVASMRRARSERESMLQACGAVYAMGVTPRWEAVAPLRTTPVDLPAYPWQRERYWLRDLDREAGRSSRREVPGSDGLTTSTSGAVAYSSALLLGMRTESGGAARVEADLEFETVWPSAALQWLADHRIGQSVVMPGAAMIEVLRAAARRACDGAAVELTDFVVHDRLILDDERDAAPSWGCAVRRDDGGRRLELFAVDDASSSDDASWRTVASARAFVADDSPVSSLASEPESTWHDDSASLYESFAALGVRFGPAFRTIERWRVDSQGAECWLARRDGAASTDIEEGVHPAVLDGLLQLAVLAITSTDGKHPGALMLPLGIESYRVLHPVPTRVRAVVRIERAPDADAATAQAQLIDAHGRVVAVVQGARFAPVTAAALGSFERTDRDVYTIGWRRVAGAEPVIANAASGRWIVLADDSELGTALRAGLRAAGGEVLDIRTGQATSASADGFTVRCEDSEGLQRALLALLNDGRAPVRGIVHAWSADCSADRSVAARVPAGDDDWLAVGSALGVVQALGTAAATVPLWLVTQASQEVNGAVVHPRHAGLWGLASVVAVEHADLACRVVDLEATSAADQASSLIRELVRSSDGPLRVALRGEERLVPVLARYRSASGPATVLPKGSRLERSESGALDELRWVSARPCVPGPGEVRLRVEVVGVNFRDVLLSLGMYPGTDGVLGAECVGVVEALGEGVTEFSIGERVFGFAPGSMASTVLVPSAFLSRLPEGLSVEQAAATPVAFLTAMLGLYRIADIGAGTHVLIHAAAGGVGLAAVQLAQRRGAVVHATAGSTAKREFLRSMGVRHVYDSRSLDFADEALAATDGRGVDVVLNSLAGDFIDASVRALAPGGWMLELGKRDLWTPERMATVRPDVQYRVYDLGTTVRNTPDLLRPMLDVLVRELEDGSLKPLPVRAFGFSEVASAFRFMAQARHIGKLVLRAPRAAGTDDGAIVRASGTYLVTGGTGALGLRTARWLAASGARSLVLTGRRAPSADAMRQIDEIRALGATVHVRAVDAADAEAMQALFGEMARDMPALRGVVHAAGVVDDGVLMQYSWPRVQAVMRGKSQGARVLDQLTEQLPLDFFVLYSSAGLHLGPLGQGAYAAANAELDALASSRRGRGLPALSVAWGQWPDGGMATAMHERGADVWSARGLAWIDPSRAFVQLERLLRDDAAYAAVFPMQWDRFLSRLPSGLDAGFFQAMARATAVATADDTGATGVRAAGLVEQWRREPESAWPELILAHVARSARHVLGVDDSFPIGGRTALKDVGLDSLMAVELRNVLTRSLGKSLPATLLFDYPSLDALVGYLQRIFGLQPGPAPVEAVSEARPATDAISALSDEEAESLLLAELDSADSRGQP
jgi:acyl transferase domain-containing protein/acyl carrier protein